MNNVWEDNIVERKVESDLKDLLKTLVGFANSVKHSHIATLYIGELDDGTVQGVTNPDNILKEIRKKCDLIYPEILWRAEVYQKNDLNCIKVEVEYSGETPHFGGPAWIRKGSETIKASDQLFQKLIDLRASKVYEINKWIEKSVTARFDQTSLPLGTLVYGTGNVWTTHKSKWPEQAIKVEVIEVTQFYISVKKPVYEEPSGQAKYPSKQLSGMETVSIPLSKIILSFDNENKRLELIIQDY